MKKSGLDILNILKYLVLLGIIVYVVILVRNAGGDAPFETVQKNVAKVVSTEGMKEGSTQDLKQYYGLNANDFDGVYYYLPDDVMSVNEVLVIRLKQESQQEVVEEAAQTRLDTQLESFEGYGAEQTALLKSAILEARGNYVILVVSEDEDKIYEAFKNSL